MSDKVKPHHLQRKALLYIRQSSAFQVQHNQESRRLQYAMRERLQQLGWHDIEVIDEDLGRSGAGTVTRHGFERMVADVCLGKVGAVAAREVSRFARNSREWQRLVEMCRVVDTLLIDQDTVYAPRQGNDRLLLGLKGSLNEYELDLLRARSVEARHEKARRGELLVAAPVGFVKTDDQRLEKDPDRRVQEAIGLAFRKCRELASVRQTLLWFIEEDLPFPTRQADGSTIWKRPTYASLHRVLTHPAYGGAYAYGKTEVTVHYGDGTPRRRSRRKPPAEWLALRPHAHEGYIGWEAFQQLQQVIAANVQGGGTPGAAKRGAALLAGLLRCRRCGRKLTVRYTGREHEVQRYCCHRGRLDQGEPNCIAFGGIPVDEALGREVVRLAQPAAVAAAATAARQACRQRDEVRAALERDLQAARYEVQRARKQYDGVDPENRLVADELERRWEQALLRVRALESGGAAGRRRGGAVGHGRGICGPGRGSAGGLERRGRRRAPQEAHRACADPGSGRGRRHGGRGGRTGHPLAGRRAYGAAPAAAAARAVHAHVAGRRCRRAPTRARLRGQADCGRAQSQRPTHGARQPLDADARHVLTKQA